MRVFIRYLSVDAYICILAGVIVISYPVGTRFHEQIYCKLCENVHSFCGGGGGRANEEVVIASSREEIRPLSFMNSTHSREHTKHSTDGDGSTTPKCIFTRTRTNSVVVTDQDDVTAASYTFLQFTNVYRKVPPPRLVSDFSFCFR